MTELLNAIGLASGDATQLVILAAALLIGLFLLRMAFKLTAALFRLGCLAILFIVAATFVFKLLN